MKTTPTTPTTHYTEIERMTPDTRVEEQLWAIRRARDNYLSATRSAMKRLRHLTGDAAAGGAAKRALAELNKADWLAGD